jgi:PIN domain nuclease of toxin-antitoxin system
MLDHEPDIYVSPAIIWEVTIKQAIGKLQAPTDLPEQIRDSGFQKPPIMARHAIAAGRLPQVHRDPFDRMLVAQAQCEALTLLTKLAQVPGSCWVLGIHRHPVHGSRERTTCRVAVSAVLGSAAASLGDLGPVSGRAVKVG